MKQYKMSEWSQWSNHVLLTLEDQSNSIKEVHNNVIDLKIEMREIKTKLAIRAASMGVVGGMIISVITAFITKMI